jgi:hypothetical protein
MLQWVLKFLYKFTLMHLNGRFAGMGGFSGKVFGG